MTSSSPSQWIPMLLNLLAAIVGAGGQYLYKLGSQRLGIDPIFKNWQLMAGMILFCVVMVLFVVAFKMGGRLSVVYPVYATTFVWGTLIAVFLGGEKVSPLQILGVLVLVAGVSMVAIGAKAV